MERPGGVVFVGEDHDAEDLAFWPGVFSAHWESDEGEEHEDGPQGVSVDEAIAWGRARAEIVLVRPGDEDVHYSAGAQDDVDDDGAPLPRWPEGRTVARRRDPRR